MIFISCLGAVAAYAILIGIVGTRWVRAFYQRHESIIIRLCSMMFIGFVINALVRALPGLKPNKA
ncbi:L-lysine permease [Pseudomonas sp. FEN]|nr:L-lysine permease [Pseudomonas sp. FEN]